MFKRIFLVRHGEIEANQQKVVCGQLDQSLNERGRQQVGLLTVSSALILDASTVLVSSHLSRAIETARILFPERTPTIDSSFAEIDTGEYSSLRVDEMVKLAPHLISHAKNPDEKYPGGESLTQFFGRVQKAFKKLQETSAENLVLVSHGGVINVILHTILQSPLSLFPSFEIPNASVTRLTFDPAFGFYRLNDFGKAPCTL